MERQLEFQKRALKFKPPIHPFDVLYQRALEKHPLSGKLDPLSDHAWSVQEADREFKGVLKSTIQQFQKDNGPWAEERINILRREFGDWSLDGVLVDGEGRIVSKPWSTFWWYIKGQRPPNLETLFDLMKRNGGWFLPVVPQRDSALFWLYDQEELVRQVLERQLGQKVEAENYPISSQVAPQMPDMIRMTRVQRQQIGPAKLAQAEIVLGKLGFWHSPLARDRFLWRVDVDSRVLGRHVMVSPLRREFVIVRGGLPMEEKHEVDVLRTDSQIASLDFPAAVFKVFAENFDRPLILRFNTLRPWLGEEPKLYTSSR